MNRSTRTLVVFLMSLVVAAGASFVVYQAARNAPAPSVAATVPVAVAARALPAGAKLTAEDIRMVDWPAANQIQGGVSRSGDAVGRGLIAAVVENEPLSASKLAAVGSGAGLPPMITAGMRAISVKVDDVVGVAGFAEPGAHVDVVVTISQRDESVSRVVVSNVEILAAGTRADQARPTDTKAALSSVVTLLVTPEDAERISLASSIGRIMLTLRHPLDASTTDTSGTRVAALLGTPPPPPPAATPRPVAARAPKAAVVMAAPPPPPPPYTVETIRAAKRTAEVVK